ncbi:MAG: hypothetical protein EHM93_13605 [Bacteroidales bacterium]|nr:MAG: hypothetical protein EHM93_13605 [Bacteroidales bacterium]
MKRLEIYFSLLLIFNAFTSAGQKDTSLLKVLKPTILDHAMIKKNTDTSEFRVQSASRSLKYISDLPMSIYVVTHDEIIKKGYVTLTDVLKSLPGVRVSQPGSGELGETFQFRGLLGNLYTKILLNNIPIKPSGVAGMPISSQLPIRQAERIEIIYGPAAAAYGVDAVTGVINIILKEADRGTFVRGDIFGGGSGYNYLNFTIAGKAGKNRNILNYCFYGSRSVVNDFNIKSGYEGIYNPLANLHQSGIKIDLGSGPIDPLLINSTILQSAGITETDFKSRYYGVNYKGTLTEPIIEDIGSSSQNVGINLKWRGINFSFNNMYRRTHSSIGLSPLLYRYDNPQNFWGENINHFALSYNHQWRSISTSTNLSGINYMMDNASSLGVTKLNTDRAYLYSTSSDILLEELLTIFPFKNTEIVLGGSLQANAGLPLTNFLENPFNPSWYKVLDGSNIPQHPVMGRFGQNLYTSNNSSFFSQAFIVLNKFRIMGGIRFDGNTTSTKEFDVKSKSINPRLAIMYKLSNSLSFTSSYGTAFKAAPPSIAYRSMAYVPIDKPDSVKYLSIPNGTLKPEKYRSIEFGMNAKVYDYINVNLSVYFNEITNLISNKLVPIDVVKYPLATAYTDSLWASTYVNAASSKSDMYGMQATMLFKNIVPSIKFSMTISYSYSYQTDNISRVSDVIGSFQLTPKHIGHLEISTTPIKNISLIFDYYWNSKWIKAAVPVDHLSKKVDTNVDGYVTADITSNIKLGENLSLMIVYKNIFNQKYGGIGVTGLSYDLPFNPQSGTTVQFGLSYTLN